MRASIKLPHCCIKACQINVRCITACNIARLLGYTNYTCILRPHYVEWCCQSSADMSRDVSPAVTDLYNQPGWGAFARRACIAWPCARVCVCACMVTYGCANIFSNLELELHPGCSVLPLVFMPEQTTAFTARNFRGLFAKQASLFSSFHNVINIYGPSRSVFCRRLMCNAHWQFTVSHVVTCETGLFRKHYIPTLYMHKNLLT